MTRRGPGVSPRLLEIRDLAVSFDSPTGEVRAVRGVSLDIDAGETVALVGESGSGKSVTALSILQLLPYPPARHPGGSIRFRGQELLGAAEPVLRRVRGDRIAMVFQEPMTSLNPLHTIEKQVNEVLLVHKELDRATARARTLELLRLCGLADAERRLNAYPHQLSGGERQRVMIAMALANDPDLLIADEPTTALDVTIQAQILRLLRDLQARFEMALLLITHDLTMVRKVARRVYVMTEGEIVEAAGTAELFERPRHPYTRRLLEAQPKGPPPPGGDEAPVILAAQEVRVWFPVRAGLLRRTVDHIKAVDGISLAVREGHTLGVVGESGSGKTTLGLALLRLLRSRGRIQFGGREIQGLPSRALRPLRREMQIVFQDPFGSLSPRLSVGQIVGEGLRVHRLGAPAEQRALIERALREVLQEFLAEKGYDVRPAPDAAAAIAAVTAEPPDVVLLDIQMPGLGGIDALAAIRAVAPDVKVIMVSGTSSVDLASRALAYGAFDYVAKPIDLAYLQRSLETAFMMKGLERG